MDKLVQAGPKGQLFPERSNVPLEGRAAEYAALAQKNPDNPDILWKYSYTLMADHRLYREALDAICAAIALDPLNPTYHIWRGWYYLKLNRFEEATAEYALVGRLQPLGFASPYHLGMARIYLEDYAGAIECYERIFEIGIDQPDGDRTAVLFWYWLAMALEHGEDVAAEAMKNHMVADDFFPEPDPFGVGHASEIYFYGSLLSKRYISPEALLVEAGAGLSWEKDRYGDLKEDIGLILFVAVFYDMIGKADKACELYQHVLDVIGDDTPLVMGTVFGKKRLALLRDGERILQTAGILKGGN